MGVLTQYGSDIGGIDPELISKIGTDPLNTTAQNLSGAVNELDASKIVTLTNAEYEALTPEEKNNNKYYHITDRNSSDSLDTNVMQTESTSNADYEVLLSNNASTATEINGVNKSSGLKYNPSTGDLELTHGNSDIVLSGNNDYWYGTKTSLKDAVSSLNTGLALKANASSLPKTSGAYQFYYCTYPSGRLYAGAFVEITIPIPTVVNKTPTVNIIDVYVYDSNGNFTNLTTGSGVVEINNFGANVQVPFNSTHGGKQMRIQFTVYYS